MVKWWEGVEKWGRERQKGERGGVRDVPRLKVIAYGPGLS